MFVVNIKKPLYYFCSFLVICINLEIPRKNVRLHSGRYIILQPQGSQIGFSLNISTIRETPFFRYRIVLVFFSLTSDCRFYIFESILLLIDGCALSSTSQATVLEVPHVSLEFPRISQCSLGLPWGHSNLLNLQLCRMKMAPLVNKYY